MSGLVCVTLDGTRYAVRADRIVSRERVRSLHRLPFAGPGGAVLAMIGARAETLADLSVCLGHSPTGATDTVYAFLVSKDASMRGFIVGSEPIDCDLPADGLVPTPPCLHSPLWEGFVVNQGAPVAVIDIATAHELARAGNWTAPRVPLSLGEAPAARCDETVPYRIVTVGNTLYALPTGRRQWEPTNLDGLFESPILPPAIDGVAITDGIADPVIDLSRRLGGDRARSLRAVLASVGDARVALLVDDDKGIWGPGSITCREIPALARPPGVRAIVQRAGEVSFQLDLGALLGADASESQPALPRYTPSSDFTSRFRHGEVEVREVVLLGMRHALPKSEVRDVVSGIPVRRIPQAPPVVAGVAEYEGVLLPVLDLESGFTDAGRATSGMSMVALENGDFRALLLCENVLDERTVSPNDQRPVPYAASHPFLYGCYVDGEAVRLIFNIAAIGVQFSLRIGEARQSLAEALRLAGRSADHPSESPENRISAAQDTPEPPAAREVHGQSVPPTENADTRAEESVMRAARASGNADTQHAADPGRAESGSSPVEASTMPVQPAVGSTQDRSTQPESGPLAAKKATEPGVEPDVERAGREPGAQLPGGAAGAQGPGVEPAVAASSEATRQEPGTSAAPGSPPKRSRRLDLRSLGIVVVSLIAAIAVVLIVPGIRMKLFPWGTRTSPPALVQPAGKPPPATPAESRPAPESGAKGGGTSESSEPAQQIEYVVREGDTLWDIAERFTGDPHHYRQIAAANGIEDPDRIVPGQRIRLVR